MTTEQRQLMAWYLQQPGRSVSRDLAIGYLLARSQQRDVTPKLERECRITLESMRTERARQIARAA